LGDIILSYAHLVKPGITSAFLPDYYTGTQVRIKLDPKLDGPGNAQRYYRKSQNEVIEKEKIAANLLQAERNLEAANKAVSQIQSALEFSDIRSLRNETQPIKKIADTKPYKEVEFNGIQIWVGKNAKSNDEMLRLAGKNDLWLHSKDTSGSHVIIRKTGKTISVEVIQFAAKLAAKNSKARTQSLVPVMITERKFVSKPKNSNPGEVKVVKFDTIDAETTE
jgi:predicted ribosome quality control (RQC) complex YloA/Tae2 family protein